MASKAKVFYETACNIHGVGTKIAGYKAVKVASPKTRREALHGGCPLCKADK